MLRKQHFVFICPGNLRMKGSDRTKSAIAESYGGQSEINPFSYPPTLQAGSSLKLPTGQFFNGRSPQDERVRSNEVRSVPSALPLRPYNPLNFKEFLVSTTESATKSATNFFHKLLLLLRISLYIFKTLC